MKNVIYILLLLLSACRFSPGAAPNNEPSSDVVDSNPNLKDMARDTKPIEDVLVADLGRDLSTKKDTSPDMQADLTVDVRPDVRPPDMTETCNGMTTIDLKTDSQHCGECNNRCDPEFAECAEGNCECPENAEPCGADNTCKDTKNDPLNCGGCGVTCGLATECVNSACVCRDGYRDCNGKCVNLRADPLNCGDCDNVCQGNKSACNNGSCERSCFGGGWSCDVPTGQTYCGTRPDIYTCNSRATDNCGTECGVGETCERTGTVTYECITNRPTIGCQSCPCVECGQDEDCVVSAFAGNEVFCVEK